MKFVIDNALFPFTLDDLISRLSSSLMFSCFSDMRYIVFKNRINNFLKCSYYPDALELYEYIEGFIDSCFLVGLISYSERKSLIELMNLKIDSLV